MAIFGTQNVRTGMQVVGSDGTGIGSVKEVRENDFLVSRAMKRDLYVPFNAIGNVSDNTITLNIPSSQVDNMGWQSPPLMGTAGH
ncbi:MAG: DUF2171 domain-containing protein [Chloroflexi bacterium]|nr:DUF2171 domain-containing protein [Chloroflexota bacterium]